MLFESERDKSAFFSRTDNICCSHFHRSAELLYAVRGEKTVWLDSRQYVVKPGQLLV